MNIFLRVLFLLASGPAFANTTPPLCMSDTLLPPETRCEAPETTYAYFNHNSSEWDRPTQTRTPAIRLKRLVDQKQIPTFIASSEFGVSNFVQPGTGDYTLLSEGGEHQIVFSHLSRIIFSGGNLSACLCNAFSSVLKHQSLWTGSVEMLFVLEATYSSRVDPVLNEFRSPNLGASEIPLSVAFEEMGLKATYDYVRKNLLGGDNGFICKYPTIYRNFFDDPVSTRDYSFEILRNGMRLGNLVGTGSQKVRLNFVTLAELEKILAQ